MQIEMSLEHFGAIEYFLIYKSSQNTQNKKRKIRIDLPKKAIRSLIKELKSKIKEISISGDVSMSLLPKYEATLAILKSYV